MTGYSFGPARPTSRAAKGHVIEALQRALGIGPETVADQSCFGPNTTAATRSLQQANGLPESGRAGPAEFAILGLPWPDVVERAIQLSASDGFEGASFTAAFGSLNTSTDDGITWGIIGFTSFNGEVQELLRAFRDGNAARWVAITAALAPGDKTRIEAAIVEDAAKNDLGDWGLVPAGAKKDASPAAKAFFKALGLERGMQELQMGRARSTYDAAAQDLLARAFAIDVATVDDLSPLARALAYDIRVLSAGPSGGGHEDGRGGRFQFEGFAMLAGMPWGTETERLRQIADVTIARITDRWAPEMVHSDGARRRWLSNILGDDGEDADLRSFALKPV